MVSKVLFYREKGWKIYEWIEITCTLIANRNWLQTYDNRFDISLLLNRHFIFILVQEKETKFPALLMGAIEEAKNWGNSRSRRCQWWSSCSNSTHAIFRWRDKLWLASKLRRAYTGPEQWPASHSSWRKHEYGIDIFCPRSMQFANFIPEVHLLRCISTKRIWIPSYRW